ncbi:MAG TPA: rRNA maturation RNase YbeY [Thermoguttaceae bacterium]|nr:rRNA maturation RNase YbeY [Thermoguttaceae bacterium]
MNKHSELVIDVADEQSVLTVDRKRIRAVVRRALEASGIERAQVSVAVVDDPAIHELNRRYLRHDYPTDVLSFVLERGPGRLEGQIVVSADTAQSEAARYGWPAENELLLYVVHGALHLAGCEDSTPESREEMRRKEREVLKEFGLTPPWRAPRGRVGSKRRKKRS